MKSKYYFKTYTIRAGCCVVLLLGMLTVRPVAQGLVEMSSGSTTEITGIIHVETNGDWLNQGTLLAGTSALLLYGGNAQMLRQDGGAFHDLVINKSTGEVALMSSIHLNGGTLSILNQDLSLNGHLIMLDPSAMLDETSGQTIKGPAGHVMTTRMLSAPAGTDIAGMGFVLTSNDNFGLTEIRRGHAAQSANGHEGILRYFEVIPEFNVESEATIQILYDESELNGNAEADLKMYHSPDGGINWVEVNGALDVTSNSFEAAGVSSLSRFTLSSFCLETCMATEAKAKPATVYLNVAGLGFILPAGVDDGSRGACGIDSLKVIPEAFTCADAGIREVVLVVKDNNGCTKSATTTIEVIDDIPPVVVCKNITVSVGESCQAVITPDDLDNGSYDGCGVGLSIDVSTFDCDDLGLNPVMLTATDASGNTSQCEAIVTVEMEISVECQDAEFSLDANGSVTIDPFDLITGDPGAYEGYTFSVEPDTFSCDELGEHQVTLTSTDPFGEVTICEVTVTIFGPDADCDGVADLCDLCDGGNDLLDTDSDGTPDCVDWDGWPNLIEEWQCAANKVFLCHEGNVICVNQSAVQAHLDHGDFMGSCDAAFCDEPPALLATSPGERVNGYEVQKVNAIPLVDKILSSQEVPGEVLIENRPNPFFPETTIRFYLPQQDGISLVVYDMMGSQVDLIAKGVFDSGWQEVVFDGSDHPDGVYIYMLRTARHCKTGTMVLAR